MIKKRSALALCVALAMGTAAYADDTTTTYSSSSSYGYGYGDPGDRWYVTPFIGGISPDHKRDLVDHDFLYGAAIGRELGPWLNLQLNMESARLGNGGRFGIDRFGNPFRRGANHLNQFYPALEVQGLLNRNWVVSPYAMVGIGVLRNVFSYPYPSQTHLAPEAGIGAYIHLWDSGTSGLALRPEIKARWDNPSRDQHLVDYIATIGVQFSFGGSSYERHAETTTYETAPSTAYVAPPPPPPPPAAPPPASGFPEAGGTVALTGVTFLHDSTRLTTSSHTVLDDMAKGLREHPNLRVEIQGHTDSTGSASYNESLSQRRADSVRQYLLEHGVRTSQVVAKGYGESQPIDSNSTAEGRAHNRRVIAKVLSNPTNVAVEGAGETHLATPGSQGTPR